MNSLRTSKGISSNFSSPLSWPTSNRNPPNMPVLTTRRRRWTKVPKGALLYSTSRYKTGLPRDMKFWWTSGRVTPLPSFSPSTKLSKIQNVSREFKPRTRKSDEDSRAVAAEVRDEDVVLVSVEDPLDFEVPPRQGGEQGRRKLLFSERIELVGLLTPGRHRGAIRINSIGYSPVVTYDVFRQSLFPEDDRVRHEPKAPEQRAVWREVSPDEGILEHAVVDGTRVESGPRGGGLGRRGGGAALRTLVRHRDESVESTSRSKKSRAAPPSKVRPPDDPTGKQSASRTVVGVETSELRRRVVLFRTNVGCHSRSRFWKIKTFRLFANIYLRFAGRRDTVRNAFLARDFGSRRTLGRPSRRSLPRPPDSSRV